ncbi:hypothetical protein GCM10011344_03210 [Dokdonia pacifica]|nr:hypothetical protein GCM10011344_03210 [Dokdonia pacifica]
MEITRFNTPYRIFCVFPKPSPLNILPFQIPSTKCGIVLINVSPIRKSIIEKFITIFFVVQMYEF